MKTIKLEVEIYKKDGDVDLSAKNEFMELVKELASKKDYDIRMHAIVGDQEMTSEITIGKVSRLQHLKKVITG